MVSFFFTFTVLRDEFDFGALELSKELESDILESFDGNVLIRGGDESCIEERLKADFKGLLVGYSGNDMEDAIGERR